MSEDRWNDEAEQDQFAREEVIWRAKEARRKNSQSSLLWGFGAALALILLAFSAHAADRDNNLALGEKPSSSLCWFARRARDLAGGERAAEDAARAQGVSEATIAKAKRCPR